MDCRYVALDNTLKVGVNIDPSGIRIYKSDDWMRFIVNDKGMVNEKIFDVSIHDDADIICENDVIKCNKINLSNPRNIWEDEQMCLDLAEVYFLTISYAFYKSRELHFKAIKHFPYAIGLMTHPPQELCDFAVSVDVNAIKFITHKTEELCIKAVSKRGKLLKYINSRDQTKDIVKAAVAQDGRALKFADGELIDDEIIEIAKRQIASTVIVFDSDCYKLYTQNGWITITVDKNYTDIMEALNIEGKTLRYVKEQTEEMCMVAVMNNPLALKYVKNKTYKLCEAAVKNNALAAKYVDGLSYEETKNIINMTIRQNRNKAALIKSFNYMVKNISLTKKLINYPACVV